MDGDSDEGTVIFHMEPPQAVELRVWSLASESGVQVISVRPVEGLPVDAWPDDGRYGTVDLRTTKALTS